MQKETWGFLNMFQKVYLIEYVHLNNSNFLMSDLLLNHSMQLGKLGLYFFTCGAPSSKNRNDRQFVLIENFFEVFSIKGLYNRWLFRSIYRRTFFLFLNERETFHVWFHQRISGSCIRIIIVTHALFDKLCHGLSRLLVRRLVLEGIYVVFFSIELTLKVFTGKCITHFDHRLGPFVEKITEP